MVKNVDGKWDLQKIWVGKWNISRFPFSGSSIVPVGNILPFFIYTNYLPAIYSYFQFRFADGTDKFLMFLGVIGSIIFGAIAPVQCVLMGELVDDFVDFTICRNNINCTDPPDLQDSMTTIGQYCFMNVQYVIVKCMTNL